MFKKANNTNELIESMEDHLQDEFLRDSADNNKLKATAINHLSKASLLFKEMGKRKESLIVNDLIKTAQCPDKKKDSKSPEMREFFEWLGFDSKDINFIQDSGHEPGYASYADDRFDEEKPGMEQREEVEWPKAEEIRENIEGEEIADPQEQRNYTRDSVLKGLEGMRGIGNDNDKFKKAIRAAVLLIVRSAEADQNADEEKAQEYLNKGSQLFKGLQTLSN